MSFSTPFSWQNSFFKPQISQFFLKKAKFSKVEKKQKYSRSLALKVKAHRQKLPTTVCFQSKFIRHNFQKSPIKINKSFHSFFIFFCGSTITRKQACWLFKPAFLAPICILDCQLLLLGVHGCKPLRPGASSRRCYLLFGSIPFPFFPKTFASAKGLLGPTGTGGL